MVSMMVLSRGKNGSEPRTVSGWSKKKKGSRGFGEGRNRQFMNLWRVGVG